MRMDEGRVALLDEAYLTLGRSKGSVQQCFSDIVS